MKSFPSGASAMAPSRPGPSLMTDTPEVTRESKLAAALFSARPAPARWMSSTPDGSSSSDDWDPFAVSYISARRLAAGDPPNAFSIGQNVLAMNNKAIRMEAAYTVPSKRFERDSDETTGCCTLS